MISVTLIEMCVQSGGVGAGGELDHVDRLLLREIPVPEALKESIRHGEGEGLAMKAFFSQELPFGTHYTLATWDG